MKLSRLLPVQGRLRRGWIFAYRAPLDRVAAHLPPQLKPLSFGGFGFWNVIVCEVEGIRPSGTPRAFGLTYRHAAYRIYARHDSDQSGSVAGLYYLRSDCDHPIVASAGQLVTDFDFHRGRIELRESPLATVVQVDAPGARGAATVYYGRKLRIPEGSPFQSVQEAAQFLSHRPCGIAVDDGEVRVLPARRDEAQWKATVVYAGADRWEMLAPDEAVLEVAFEVAPVEYEWLPAQAA